MSGSLAIDTVNDIDRNAPDARRLDTEVVSLRDFPYPYRAALAICSDIDETRDVDEFLTIQRFLNTQQPTSMGRGLGLEIGNSFYFFDDRNEFAYFNHDERTQRVIVDCTRAGYIDCLHSYGDSARGRDDALRALEVLERENCRLDVWVNHFGSRSNFSRKFEYMLGPSEGDDPGAALYHADVTIGYGIRFVWVGAVTRLVGQSPSGRARLWSAGDPGRPLRSSLNVLKEIRKKALGLCGDERFVLRRHNQLMRPLRLGDGQRVHEFMRYCRHPVGIDRGATSLGLAYAISPGALDHLKRSQGSMIVYTHLGKNGDCSQPVAAPTQAALRGLEREFREGQIYVATTSRLLNYHRARRHLDWSWTVQGPRTQIHIQAIADPVFPEAGPSTAHLGGLTFYVPRAADTDVLICGKELAGLRRNPPDATGRESVTIPSRRLEFPC